MHERMVVCDSVTTLPAGVRGHVVIAASHGGVYAVHLALSQGVVGLIVCDGGVGLENAGIAGLDFAQTLGVPCAALASHSACIGDGADCARHGTIAFANAAAQQWGVSIGQAAMQAAQCMAAAPLQAVAHGPLPGEARVVLPTPSGQRPIVLIDSVSLVLPEDAGAVVLTGSHGNLQGGRAETAIKADVFAVLYNDAGVAQPTRLPALDARGISAVTVAAHSARIGDARSAWETGILSHANQTALQLGAYVGQTAHAWAKHMARQVNT